MTVLITEDVRTWVLCPDCNGTGQTIVMERSETLEYAKHEPCPNRKCQRGLQEASTLFGIPVVESYMMAPGQIVVKAGDPADLTRVLCTDLDVGRQLIRRAAITALRGKEV